MPEKTRLIGQLGILFIVVAVLLALMDQQMLTGPETLAQWPFALLSLLLLAGLFGVVAVLVTHRLGALSSRNTELEQELAVLTEKARSGNLSMQDLQGGCFTISNGGTYGSLLSTPILNPPQSGILGMHAIQERPVVRDGQIVARPMMYLALSYDHRLVDGKQAVQFLIAVKNAVENPVFEL